MPGNDQPDLWLPIQPDLDLDFEYLAGVQSAESKVASPDGKVIYSDTVASESYRSSKFQPDLWLPILDLGPPASVSIARYRTAGDSQPLAAAPLAAPLADRDPAENPAEAEGPASWPDAA